MLSLVPPNKPALQIFRRYELKFWSKEKHHSKFINYLQQFMDFDNNCPNGKSYQVTSLYFDGYGLPSHQEKLNGDLLRYKYRVRYYNEKNRWLFIEVKKKYDAFIHKTRGKLTLPSTDFENLESLISNEEHNKNKDFLNALKILNLQPCCWVRYKRIALRGKNNPNLRITFDTALSGMQANGFEHTHSFQTLCTSNWDPPGIMEIKFDRFFPLWLEKMMRESGLIQESISKFSMTINRFGTYREA